MPRDPRHGRATPDGRRMAGVLLRLRRAVLRDVLAALTVRGVGAAGYSVPAVLARWRPVLAETLRPLYLAEAVAGARASSRRVRRAKAGRLVTKMGVPERPPDEAAVWAATRRAAAALAADWRSGSLVRIPELLDAVRAEVPGLGPTEFHRLLQAWQASGRLTLQFVNDRANEPRHAEGIETERGTRFYVQVNPEAERPRPVATPATPAGAGLSFDLVLPQVEQAAERLTLAFVQSTLDTIQGDVAEALEQTRRHLAEGLAEGETARQLTARLRETFTQPGKAETIALTESSRAMHAGQAAAAQASGVVSGLEWLASSDACERCRSLDGKQVAWGQAFVEGTGPYGRVEYPPLHPHCRCAANEVIA